LPELTPDTAAPSSPARWSPLTRFSFRFAFCYFMMYALGCGNATLCQVIPVGAHIHATGSGDTAIDWIACGVMLALAIVLTLLWTALDRSRDQHPKLFYWMRFILRLTLGVAMINYGFAKVFPLQMSLPSLAVLNEPLGNTSPMTLLWTLIGLNPLYELICGTTEVVAGVLILFRRTALLGALFTAFVVSNVVLYNFFFDVPVKLYATHLLLMSLVIVAPDLRSLYRYFIQHQPAVPAGDVLSPASRRSRLIETIIITAALLLTAGVAAFQLGGSILRLNANARHPSPLAGEWHLDTATLNNQPKPYFTGDGVPMTAVFLEPTGRSMVRSSDDALWRGGYRINDKAHTLNLFAVGHGGVTYAIAQPDPTHLILTPTGGDAKTEPTLHLTRVPLPSHYPLEERGFHLINEWGLER
jgi:hypothetical protein